MEGIQGIQGINLFQWNVLTQAFCNHKSYPEEDYTEATFDEDQRRSMVVDRIRSAMREHRIIVLHEVDIKLRGVLQTLAFNQDYGIACDGHGYWRNWHMGSAVMWPNKRYTITGDDYWVNSIEYLVPGELIKANVEDPSPEPPGTLMSWAYWVASPFVRGYQWTFDIKRDTRLTLGQCYQEAARRTNKLIHVTLSHGPTEENVHVWAYHMPCAFRDPAVMEYHADQLIRSVQESASAADLSLLCMDGNFQPGSECYSKFIKAGFVSAAFVADGKEPDWTCSSNSHGNAFAGTLDYVWCLNRSQTKRTFEVKWADVNAEPQQQSQQRPPFLPTEKFPSDHLWMDVSIRSKD